MSRAAQLAANLAEVRARIERARRHAGRSDPVVLVAVTKTRPASDVALLAELGLTDVAENRDQEARAKHTACAGLPLRWHFVGRLQRNKAGSVARYADVVQSVDTPALVDALTAGARAAGRRLDVLIQVSLEDPPAPGRGGAPVTAARALADLVAGTVELRLRGVMAVAPRGADPAAAFARLAAVAADVRAAHPAATIISAGMSGDLEAAVGCGATHLRIGTALLGPRAPVVG